MHIFYVSETNFLRQQEIAVVSDWKKELLHQNQMAFRFLVSMGSARASEPVTTRSGSVKNRRKEQPPPN
jgi:hypothetical protein